MHLSKIEWVVLELTPKADNEDPDAIRASIRHHIRDAEVFIPASIVQRGDQRVYHYLMDGYAFVLHKHTTAHYKRLEETKYVQGPIYTGNRRDRRLATVPQDQIDKLKSQIKVEVDQGIEVGDTVMITSGPYKNITAIVKEEIPEQDSVTVYIHLRSTDRLITLPRAFLRLEMKSPIVIFKPRVDEVQKWIEMAKHLSAWPSTPITDMHDAQVKFLLLDRWKDRIQSVYRVLQGYHHVMDFQPLDVRLEIFNRLDRCLMVQRQVRFLEEPLIDVGAVSRKYQDYAMLSSANDRIANIYMDVKRMTEDSPVNLVVDGTQLFIRCSEAPGLGSLTDSKGNPTGGIVGFLRGLGAYKKRFPGVNVFVCWDGSSQRRKAMYDGYKANRTSRSGQPSFGMDWLRTSLPLFGVHQAINYEEEADDVMASLVRGPLKSTPNVLLTTDRDLLQVVSEFTHQLCPAVGGGKEKLYDVARVREEYGVAPETMVHIRALSGDTSDNIPGVPGFGLKTASKVVKSYGTVTALLKSNMAGLSKNQATKLRANEQQILNNLELLKLQDVAFEHISPNPDQEKAKTLLETVEIKPDSILTSFFL